MELKTNIYNGIFRAIQDSFIEVAGERYKKKTHRSTSPNLSSIKKSFQGRFSLDAYFKITNAFLSYFLVQKEDNIAALKFVLSSIKINPFSDTFIFKSCMPSFW